MSASARRTLDTDNITLRTVFARAPNNSYIQSTLALTADGRGGTRWTHPSSLGTYTLNYISTNAGLIQWDLSLNNIFYLTGGQGAGVASTLNPYEAQIYGKAYQALYDRNNGSEMTVNDSIFRLYSTIYLSTTTQQFYTTINREFQTLHWHLNPFKFLVANNSTPTLADISYNEINFDNVVSSIRLMGTKDIQFSTISSPQRAIYVSISTFTSEGYLGLSGEISSLRGLSTTIPYHFRSTFLLNASNSYPRIGNLSTSYVGDFTATYVGPNPPLNVTCTPTSSIGFPYSAAGLRGGNIIQSFQEVIGATTYTVNITEKPNTYNGDVYFSTLTFSMAPFSTFINRNNSTSIVLSYTPTYLFTGYSTSGSVGTINPIGFSTFITAGNEVIPTTQTDDVVYFTNTPLNQNFYKANLNITLTKANVVPRYTCTFTVNHYMPGALGGYSNANPSVWPPTSYNFTRTGLSSITLNAATPARNSAYITIIGS